MTRIRINKEEFPIVKGESWWIVHPNTNIQLRIPPGGVTLCKKEFIDFKRDIAYEVVSVDDHYGWISVLCGDTILEMPQYLFARHFDVEVFIVGSYSQSEFEKATPFDYKPTLPLNFIDNKGDN